MWELQSHMVEYMAPSIMKAAQEQDDPLGWLCERVVDQSWQEGQDYDAMVVKLRAEYSDAEGKPVYWGPLVETLVNAAKEFAATTNGGHEFYLDDWTTVPWCSDEECQDWYG